MSTKKINVKISVVAFATILVMMLPSCQNREDDLDTEIAVPVTVDEVKSSSIEEYVSSTGTVLPTKEVMLKSQIPGHYLLAENPATGRKFALGDVVNQDQIMIHLEDAAFENEIRIESQKLNLDISEREYNKQKSLYDKGGVTLRELKNAEISFINARYAYENAILQMENMTLNACRRTKVLQAELSFISNRTFDVILANINLNSLLGLMDHFPGRLRSNSVLMLSGFFSDDLQRLNNAAERNGLEFVVKQVMNNWTVAVYRKAI